MKACVSGLSAGTAGAKWDRGVFTTTGAQTLLRHLPAALCSQHVCGLRQAITLVHTQGHSSGITVSTSTDHTEEVMKMSGSMETWP